MTISVFGMIGPVYAADAETGSGVDSAIGSVAQTDDTGPIDEAQRFAVSGSGELIYANDVAEVSVDAAAGADITLDAWTYEPLTIDAGLVGEVGFTDAGTAVWTSDAGYSTAPLPHEDGSLQIITVIDRADAPERYDYQLSLKGGLTLSPIEDGVILILDADGNYAGGVAAPWAYDANGVAVPTHFETNGTQLTQVVDHAAGDFAYPITADPYLGQQLFQWITVDRAYNDIRVNLQPTDFGRGVPPWVMTGAGWSEATSWGGSVPGYLNSKATLRQQSDCHAFGNAFAGVWNLERFRPNRTVVWSNGVGTHHCNWTTATGL